jgi:hypothetical protein
MAQYKQTIGRLEPSYVIRKASSVLWILQYGNQV